MKILACTVFCSAFYRSSLPLPKEIKGITEALQYAEAHLNDIPLGTLEYISDSDELSDINCKILEIGSGTIASNETSSSEKPYNVVGTERKFL